MIELKNINKSYANGDESNKIFSDFNLTINDGEKVAILGPSGSGKSTLLNIMSTMDVCDSGSIILDGEDISQYSSSEKCDLRLRKFAFIFQSYYMIDTLNIYDNIIVPALAAGNKTDACERVEMLAENLGISDKLYNYPYQLSGGEKQRAAIARALVNKPSVIFADEPTGNLDFENTLNVMDNLIKSCDEKTILIVVTHDNSLEKYFDRIVKLDKGMVRNEK